MENTCEGGQKSARTLLSHPLSICSVGVTNLRPCAVLEKKSEDTKGRVVRGLYTGSLVGQDLIIARKRQSNYIQV